MNTSFSGSTSLLQTPSPLDRKPSQPNSNQQLTNITNTNQTTPRSSTRTNQLDQFNPTQSSSPYAGPRSRIQSYANWNTSQHTNSTQHITPRTPPNNNSNSSNNLQFTPSYPPRQRQTPIQARVAHAAATTAEVAATAIDKVKVDRLPLGRGEAAKRLRVNSVMLVGWWIASRTAAYICAAGHVVNWAPGLDGPLHLVESCVYLLLCFNIAESIYGLQALSGLPQAQASTGVPTRRIQSHSASSTSTFATPTRSSPKTRPSPSPSLSPGGRTSPSGAHAGSPASPFRASAVGKTTPQTPSSATRSTSDVLRRSMFGTPGTPGPAVGSPLAKQDLATSIGPGFSPKHSTLGMSVSINSQEAINRLLN